jgi:hypothetical protein
LRLQPDHFRSLPDAGMRVMVTLVTDDVEDIDGEVELRHGGPPRRKKSGVDFDSKRSRLSVRFQPRGVEQALRAIARRAKQFPFIFSSPLSRGDST